MSSIYKKVLKKHVDLKGISDKELKNILDELGMDAVYNHLILGKDMTFQMFVEKLEKYVDLLKETP